MFGESHLCIGINPGLMVVVKCVGEFHLCIGIRQQEAWWSTYRQGAVKHSYTYEHVGTYNKRRQHPCEAQAIR